MLPARYDDDDDIYIYMCVCVCVCVLALNNLKRLIYTQPNQTIHPVSNIGPLSLDTKATVEVKRKTVHIYIKD